MASVGVGISTHFTGKEAAREAALHALDQVGTSRPVWALVFASDMYTLSDLHQGLAGSLGPIPYWGFSTPAAFQAEGELTRAVMVMIFTGADRKVRVYAETAPAAEATAVGKRLIRSVREVTGSSPYAMILACNGMSGDPTALLNGLAGFSAPIYGCVSPFARPPASGYLIAPSANGSTSAIAAVLSGRYRVAAGWGHGWKPLTSSRRVTGSEENILHRIENAPAAQFYAETFNYELEDWTRPPLNEIVRLYPMGVQSGMFTSELQLRSPVFVRPDGSIEMNTAIPDGKMVKLMLANPDECIQQAHAAGQQALRELGAARALFALVFVDSAWRMLFKANPKALLNAIHEGLESLPFAGVYTHGQIVPLRLEAPPMLLNQHIQVLVIGEK